MRALVPLFLLTTLITRAQPTFPPVPGADFDRRDYGLWTNPGWLLDSYGDPCPDVQFVTENASPRTYIRKDAKMSFTVTSVDTTVGGTDTLRRLDMELVGEMALQPEAIGSSVRDEWHNYYLPHCGSSGITHVIGYNRIVYEDIYPDIDLWIFSGYYGQKMMFVVHPGGDPADIVMKFTGQNELDVDMNGWLKMLLADKWITLPEAVAYQYDQNNSISYLNWGASYSANNNNGIVTFNFNGYDTSKPLVFLIGPPPPMMGGPSFDETGLCWSTYLGDDGYDYAEDIRSDDDNNLYVTGRTSSTLLQFPADPGVFYAASGNTVAFMTKFTSQHQLNWTLFYGGDLLASSSNGYAVAVMETSPRRVYVAGRTNAQDLWTVPIGGAFFDATNSSSTYKGFVAEVDDIFGQLNWATYFGEHDVEILGMDVVPGPNNVVICGKALNDLPSVQYGPPANSMNNNYVAGVDAFVAMFDVDRQLFWRSWWGGSASEIALDVSAVTTKIVMAGHTASGGIAMVDPGNGAYTQSFNGDQDVYLIEFDANGVEQWSTYLGGADLDHLGTKGLDIGIDDDVFLTGKTNGLPTLVNGPNWHDDVYDGGDGFIARFDGSDRSPKWITYLGSGATHHPVAIDQYKFGLINITGFTTDGNMPHVTLGGMYDQAGVYEISYGSFLTQFKPDQNLLHATWFGGDGGTLLTKGVAVASNSDGTFLTGVTHKASDPQAYFPLDNGQGAYWFDGEYNHLGQSVNGTDAFVTWFCQEIGTDVSEDAPSIPSTITLACSAVGVTVLGLVDGRKAYRLIDAAGRILQQGFLNSRAGRSEEISTRKLSPGAYVLQAIDVPPAGFVIQ